MSSKIKWMKLSRCRNKTNFWREIWLSSTPLLRKVTKRKGNTKNKFTGSMSPSMNLLLKFRLRGIPRSNFWRIFNCSGKKSNWSLSNSINTGRKRRKINLNFWLSWRKECPCLSTMSRKLLKTGRNSKLPLQMSNKIMPKKFRKRKMKLMLWKTSYPKQKRHFKLKIFTKILSKIRLIDRELTSIVQSKKIKDWVNK